MPVFISIAPPIALGAEVVAVAVAADRARADDERWVATVEVTYAGERRAVTGEGSGADSAQERALALAVYGALPKAVLRELLALS